MLKTIDKKMTEQNVNTRTVLRWIKTHNNCHNLKAENNSSLPQLSFFSIDYKKFKFNNPSDLHIKS